MTHADAHKEFDKAFVVKIACGALIPAIATLIFNLLGYFVDSYGDLVKPQMPVVVYDVAPGNAFAILGIGYAKDNLFRGNAIIILILLFLAIVGGDVAFLMVSRFRLLLIIFVDLLSLAGLCWSIADAEGIV